MIHWILCWLRGHDWYPHMIQGDHGEPGVWRCSRCPATEERYGNRAHKVQKEAGVPWMVGCRCLGGCQCTPTTFVFDP
jgi:hypothetical protein